jgi:hypothetical protein
VVVDRREEEIQDLQEEIKQIKSSLPAHSVPAATLIRLEELEERLEELIGEGEDA